MADSAGNRQGEGQTARPVAIAAPVGPIGVLCIRRSLHDGTVAGLVCGLGAASAGAVAAVVIALAVSGEAQSTLDEDLELAINLADVILDRRLV